MAQHTSARSTSSEPDLPGAPAPDLGPYLDRLLADRPRSADLDRDPLRFPRRQEDPLDVEVVALVASSLAFGRAASIGAAVEDVVERLGPRPARMARAGRRALAARLEGVRYRWIAGTDLAALLARAGRLQARDGSLGRAFIRGDDPSAPDVLPGLRAFAGALRGPDPSRGHGYLAPDPSAGSACKRLCLLLRWMVRPGPPDLGLWDGVDPARLIIPLDTHVHRIARYVGLTDRRTASLTTAREITAGLTRLRPDDPLVYDFALAHAGISGDCRHEAHPDVCPSCALAPVCRLAEEAGLREGGRP